MPLAKLQTSVQVEDSKKQQLLQDISGAISRITGKPETYIMVTIDNADISIGGDTGPAAYIDVRGIGGLDGSTNGQLTEALCGILTDSLAIPGDHVYITFTDVPASNWGWNGSTFG